MKYERLEINGYNLHIIKTKKFKTTTISINFREEIQKSLITKRNFLFDFLTSCSKKFNTERLLDIELENLYSMSLNSLSTKFGNTINNYIDLKFLNKKYSDKYLLNNSLELLYELLFNPNIVNNEFDLNSFKRIYNDNKTSINCLKENISRYATIRSLELMDSKDPISYNMYGSIEDLEEITPSNLYEYYKYVLKNDIIDIFVVGDISEVEIINFFKNKFEKRYIETTKTIPYITYKELIPEKNISETMDIKQSKLSIILKVIDITNFERRYVMPIYTFILGGTSNSRLFMNIREKESLAYNITAQAKSPNSIIMINAGIDENNSDKTIELIRKEINNMSNITIEELENAKTDALATLDCIFDNPKDIINYYLGLEVFNSDEITIKKENYKKVTINDIINFSKKINIAMIYLLKGDIND